MCVKSCLVQQCLDQHIAWKLLGRRGPQPGGCRTSEASLLQPKTGSGHRSNERKGKGLEKALHPLSIQQRAGGQLWRRESLLRERYQVLGVVIRRTEQEEHQLGYYIRTLERPQLSQNRAVGQYWACNKPALIKDGRRGKRRGRLFCNLVSSSLLVCLES